MTRVVELLRVSTDSQAGEDKAGLPAQHATNLRTCAQYGLEIIETVELVISGRDVADTPQMARVLQLIESGAARGIVIAEYSRLSRSDRFSDQRVLQPFMDYRAPIYLPSGPIALDTETGFVSASVYQLVATLERRRIAERMMRGKEEHRRRGEHMGGGVGLPLGVTWSKQDGWRYTEDIERVRAVFRLFLSGNHNCQAIGNLLGLARTSVSYILRNPIYSGWKVWDQKRDLSERGRYRGSKHRRKIGRAADEVIRVRLPIVPVISESDFELVQQIIANKPRVAHRSLAQHFLYRGFVSCSCGEPLYGHMGGYKGQGAYYHCKSRLASRRVTEPCGAPFVQAKYLEPALDRSIVEQLTDPDVLTAAVDAYNAQAADWQPAKPARPNQGKRARIIELYVEGVIDKAERDRRLAALDAVIPEPEKSEQLSAEDVVAFVSTLAEWAWFDWTAKRELLEAIAPDFVTRGLEVQGVRIPLLQSQPSSDGWQRNNTLYVRLSA